MPQYNPQANYSYGGGPFGNPVAPVPMPRPDLDLRNQIPGLGGLNKQASNVLSNELMGVLSPDTKRAIQDASAGMAVFNGMPGTNVIPGTLGGNRTLRDIGMTSQQMQTQGLSDYSHFVPTVSSTQTVNPALQYEVNTQNAIDAAAPNPQQAQTYAEQLFNKYISQLNQRNQRNAPQTQAESMGLNNNGNYFTPVGTDKYLPR